jgi:hypothetical protein
LDSGVNDTSVPRTALSMTPLYPEPKFERLWLPLMGKSSKKTYVGKLHYTIFITFTQNIWGLSKDNFAISKPFSKRL